MGLAPRARKSMVPFANSLRRLQLEFSQELHLTWEALRESLKTATNRYGADPATSRLLASYRGLIESKINLQLLDKRTAADRRLITLVCAFNSDAAARKLVHFTIPAAFRELWRR